MGRASVVVVQVFTVELQSKITIKSTEQHQTHDFFVFKSMFFFSNSRRL